MALFFIAGMAYASWGVHVPTVRDKFHLDPAARSRRRGADAAAWR